ncbi:MAG: Fms-interacting protein-domain-containing protein [Monoraphidium minutum]|nr:MAG: Fms-interacting protein-domain-containing protein [Monoraphidium minutum]
MAEAAAALRELVDRIAELRGPGGAAAEDPAVQDACRAGALALLALRQRYRAAALGSEAAREAAAAAKSGLDQRVLQLHNLLYEKQYYEKEVLSCTNFRSAVPDADICLIPEPEFLAAAAAAGGAPADEAAADGHKRMLARLAHELGTRKALTRDLAAARSEREAEAAAAAARKGALDALQAGLRGLEDAGRPLAAALGPRAEARAAAAAAGLLPLPLWVVYSQFRAAADALALPVEVSVDGAADAAGAPRSAAGGKGGGRSGGGAPPSKRRKEAQGLAEESVYRVHPQTVVVTLLGQPRQAQQQQRQQQRQRQALLEVRFQYYPAPGLVGACCGGGGGGGGGGDDVLGALFPGDTGDGEGYEVLAQLAGPGPYEFGTAAARARPYRWAQDLGGCDVVPSLPPAPTAAQRQAALSGLATYRKQQRVQVIVERLSEAREAAAALKALLSDLSKGRAPPTPLDASIPSPPAARLASWKLTAGAEAPASALPRRGGGGGSGARGGGSGAPSRRASDAALAALDGGGARKGAAAGAGPAAAAAAGAVAPAGGGGAAPAASEEEGEVAGGDAAGDGESAPAPAGGGGAAALESAGTLDEEALLEGLLEDDDDPAAAAAAAEAAAADAERGGESDGGGGDELSLAEAEAAADAEAEGAGAGPAAATYRCVVSGPSLEVRAAVSLFRCYPLAPPRWRVEKLARAGGGGKGGGGGDTLELPVDRLWLEREANSGALRWAADAGCLPQLLGVQLLRLRWAVDLLAAKLAAQGDDGAAAGGGGGGGGDMMALLAARQQLRGPGRHAQLVAL